MDSRNNYIRSSGRVAASLAADRPHWQLANLLNKHRLHLDEAAATFRLTDRQPSRRLGQRLAQVHESFLTDSAVISTCAL